MQTPPHRYYWGLDRKLRLSLVAFPGSSAVSKRADTHGPATPAPPEICAALSSRRRLRCSSHECRAGGPCSLRPEHHRSHQLTCPRWPAALDNPTSSDPAFWLLGFTSSPS